MKPSTHDPRKLIEPALVFPLFVVIPGFSLVYLKRWKAASTFLFTCTIIVGAIFWLSLEDRMLIAATVIVALHGVVNAALLVIQGEKT
ncbi:hypothetical protein [Billgrantia gudaonensis]|uniref:Uncharacterized protein n=1 Tax=Billgrantia gudaonensis TaxID=376427 RepID=A0A1G8PA48_9GAMM|nr:hypothetical protein [Halomonas gudaonensis]SDI89379.1 hypothetical protein SAMN04487954_10220 [Halomonas gudaonensis]